MCACTIRGRSTFFRRSHLHSHNNNGQLATGSINHSIITRMTAFTNMFLKMHLIRVAHGRHAINIVASPAAASSQGITPRHSPSVSHPRALREPSAAPSSRDPVGSRPCLESRYQAFIASRNRIKSVCLERRLVQSPHATTIIIAFDLHCAVYNQRTLIRRRWP